MDRNQIKKLDFKKNNIIINETYIDENGHEREREKNIEINDLGLDINKLKTIADEICNDIKMLSKDAEFTIQQFIDKYKVEDMDKFCLFNLILDNCKKENIIILPKDSTEVSKLPWNMLRIKKN